MKDKYTYKIIIPLIAIVFNLLILIFPEITIKSTVRGLLIWYNNAIPALLPFIISINIIKSTSIPYILSRIFSTITNRLFNIKGVGVFPIIMGMLSGYPLGAKLTCEYYQEKQISKPQAQHLLLFTNNSGPLFIIGTVGTILVKNKFIGYKMLIIHYISAIIIGILTTNRKSIDKFVPNKNQVNTLNIGEILSYTINNSIKTIVSIGGYIILFSIITGYILNFINSNYTKAIVYGIFEITGSCTLLANIKPINLPLICGLISWGGLSIHAQSCEYISKTDLSIAKYILAKLLQGTLSFVLYYIFFL